MTTVNAVDALDLRAKIAQLNNDPNEPHLINLTGNSYLVASADPAGELFGPSAFPVVKRNITIDGGATQRYFSRVPGSPAFRMFAVNAKTSSSPTAQLTLKNVKLFNAGGINIGGAAIVNDAPLRLENCVIEGTNGGGCAVYDGDRYRIDAINTAFINNTSNANGGAIYVSSGSKLYVTGCVFRGNTANRGAAIYYYNNGGSVILDTSFIENVTRFGDSYDLHFAAGLQVDARYNWWGAGPGPNSNVVGAVRVSANGVLFSPWRSAPLAVGANASHSIPRDLGLKLEVRNRVRIRYGPSIDNMTFVNPTFADIWLETSESLTYTVYARATDETGLIWYGYLHPSRPGILSWSANVDNSLAVPPTDSHTESELPDFTMPGTMPNEPAWGTSGGTPSLNFTREPFALTTNRVFRGFGIYDVSDYGVVPGCRHPGSDFFSAVGDQPGIAVSAMVSGIVVGIGVISKVGY